MNLQGQVAIAVIWVIRACTRALTLIVRQMHKGSWIKASSWAFPVIENLCVVLLAPVRASVIRVKVTHRPEKPGDAARAAEGPPLQGGGGCICP